MTKHLKHAVRRYAMQTGTTIAEVNNCPPKPSEALEQYKRAREHMATLLDGKHR